MSEYISKNTINSFLFYFKYINKKIPIYLYIIHTHIFIYMYTCIYQKCTQYSNIYIIYINRIGHWYLVMDIKIT